MIQGSLFDAGSGVGAYGQAADPPHNGTPTSREAAESMKDHVSRLRATALEAIASAGGRGMTTDEVEITTGLAHQTCSPRILELSRLGLIVQARDEAGQVVKRETRSKRKAVCWVAAEFAKTP